MSMLASLRGLLFKSASVGVGVTTGLSLTDMRLGLALSGGPTWSGKSVTVDSAMQLDAVWACVRLIAETISTLPLQLYDGADDATSMVARTHPLYPIIHDSPNADMTAVDFWSCQVACLLLWGNSYAQVVRRPNGSVILLNPLRPDRMTVRRDWNTGELIYTYNNYRQGGAQPATLVLTEDEMLHVRGFSLDGCTGLSPIAIGRQSLGTALAAEETAGRTFQNGLLTPSYIKSPTFLKSDQLDRGKAVLEEYQGAVNAGKTPLLEGGWTVENIGMNPEDMQLLDTRSFSIETICRWFGNVPPVMIGHMEKSTAWGTGLEQMNTWFLQFCLRPHLVRIEQAIGRCLLSATDRQRYYAKHTVEGLLRADSAARSALFTAYAQNGIMTRNEMRALEELPPLPGGDSLTVQAQMIPIDQLGRVAKLPNEVPLSPAPSLPPPLPAIVNMENNDAS